MREMYTMAQFEGHGVESRYLPLYKVVSMCALKPHGYDERTFVELEDGTAYVVLSHFLNLWDGTKYDRQGKLRRQK